jgi:hypothetical protein
MMMFTTAIAHLEVHIETSPATHQTSENQTKEQLQKSKQNDFDIDAIIRQSAMRYNQLFTQKLSLTIPGDYGLHAGDLVYCDFPEITQKNFKSVSQRKGGLYMIVDLSHLVTTNKTFTRLNLVRESIGRKPF